MPPVRVFVPVAVVASIGALLSLYALWQAHSPRAKRRRLRQKLPQSLSIWRQPGNTWELLEQMWVDLEGILREKGLQIWPHTHWVLRSPGDIVPLSNGYMHLGGHRNGTGPGTVRDLQRFQYSNPNIHTARTSDGLDVIIRIVVIHNEGHNHLRILRKVATGVNSLYSNNHALPMLAEVQFDDIILGVFPKVGSSMFFLYGSWARNSAGDVVEVIMQMLEGLAFIHNLGIAHRDAFQDNFVIQWQPESFKTMSISPSRPRVYLIDFEVAIDFPSDCPIEERVATGYPLGGSFLDLERYQRPHAPEFSGGKPYNPFKLDIWQLAQSLSGIRITVVKIDKVLDDMANADSDQRPSAQEALDRIRDVVNSIPPNALLIEPWMKDDWFTQIQLEAQLNAEANS
ncbi:hypothetical protein BDN70DRAFT_828108 [Pholiota conissans]|uniref:Protein kinase domain-containing protein n=1 Tax=Pholiota conissans TaxID=109636 RepID=A0A9P5Z8R6_9AGAR|nr:hypothetical protein BDN70DRAFT_828108 [Pholiota conissans]